MTEDVPKSVAAVRDAQTRLFRLAGLDARDIEALKGPRADLERAILGLERDIAAERILRQKIADRGVDILDDLASFVSELVGILRTGDADITHTEQIATAFDGFYEETANRLAELKPKP